EDLEVAEAPADDVEDVSDGRACGRGDDADHARIGGERSLAPVVEETLCLELALELLEGQVQRAPAPGLPHPHPDLVLPARRVEVEAAESHHLHAVLELEAHAAPAAAEEDGGDLRALVLQGEVRVAGAWHSQVGDLPLDPEHGEALLERGLDR